MAKVQPVKVGLIGSGAISYTYLTNLTTVSYTHLKCLAEMNFDNLFGGFDSTKVSTIEYRKSGRKLELRASDDMKYMVIFTPPMRAGGFCLENQTNATDGFNMLAQGKKDMGNVIVLPAGGRHEGWITLQAGYLK